MGAPVCVSSVMRAAVAGRPQYGYNQAGYIILDSDPDGNYLTSCDRRSRLPGCRAAERTSCVKDMPLDLTGTFDLLVGQQHTAAAYGNPGMRVLATPIVVWMVEVAAYQALQPYLDAGEGVAGMHVDLHH